MKLRRRGTSDIADLIKSEYFRLSDEELKLLSERFDAEYADVLVGASLRGRPNVAVIGVILKEASCERMGRPRRDAPTTSGMLMRSRTRLLMWAATCGLIVGWIGLIEANQGIAGSRGNTRSAKHRRLATRAGILM